MDKHIENTLAAAISAYEKTAGIHDIDFLKQLKIVFSQEVGYLEKVDLLDEAFDEQPRYEAIREVIFDLLLMNFFASDVEKLEEDYLESEEWEQIEEQTVDRGTELLNLLLYIRECIDDEIEPSLDDFLKEFLLVDEDEFQDEYRIYEPMLSNQLLIDSSYQEISRIAAGLEEEQELADLFYPMMSFFMEKKPTQAQFTAFIEASKEQAFDAAVYAVAITYNQN